MREDVAVGSKYSFPAPAIFELSRRSAISLRQAESMTEHTSGIEELGKPPERGIRQQAD